MMANVLLINPPARISDKPGFCLGIAYVASALEKSGHKVEILDINGYRHNKEKVEEIIKKSKFDIFAMGGMITKYVYIKWLVNIIKKYHPKSKIVIGGTMVACISNILLKNVAADCFIMGEGEKTLPEVISKYEKREKVNKIIISQRIKNLDEIPFPAYHLFNMDLYFNKKIRESRGGKGMAIITSRGCPFQCRFCFRNFGNEVIFRSIDNVIEEIKFLKKEYGICYIVIIDELFICNKERVFEFCKKIVPLNIEWGCEGRVNTVTEEILREIKKAGCIDIGYGIESLCQESIDEMNKAVTVDQAMNAIKITNKVGLFQVNTLIIGFPSDNKERVLTTINNYSKLPNLPSPMFYLCPYPGTYFYEKYKDKIMEKFGSEEKFVEALDDQIALNFVVNLTEISDEDLKKLKKWADRKILVNYILRHPGWIIRRLQDYRKQYGFKSTIKFILENFKVRGYN